MLQFADTANPVIKTMFVNHMAGILEAVKLLRSTRDVDVQQGPESLKRFQTFAHYQNLEFTRPQARLHRRDSDKGLEAEEGAEPRKIIKY
jgi:hypothetical protein